MHWEVFKTYRQPAGFTRRELLVVVLVVLVFTIWISITGGARVKQKAQRIQCVKNLQQIGTAERIWENDNGDQALTQWKSFLSHSNAGPLCWSYFAMMLPGATNAAKMFICPADERVPAANMTGFTNDIFLSYFVVPSGADTYPQSLLFGDRNLGRGITPDAEYGFSPTNNQGNDVAIQTNSVADPISWSLKIHSAGNPTGTGDILLGDGSGQQVTSATFRRVYQPAGSVTTNWPPGRAPSAPSFRVIFP